MTDNQANFRFSGEKRRILLVEDDIINQEMIRESVSGTYDLTVAETGEEALTIISERYETLSIVIEVLKTIRSVPAYSRLPVIVMTSDSEAEVECLSLGAVDFIPKPYPASKVVLARILRTVELFENRDILRFTERDHLTGLYNKEFFYRYAEQLDLYHKDAPTDAIVFDINRFRTINDRFGKTHGDEILKNIARKALDIVNEAGGIVCRSYADKFMIYCPHRADYGVILNALSVPLGDGENHVRLRMGVYSDVDKTLDIERRFDRAKMASDSVRDNLASPIGIYDNSMREAEMLAHRLINDFSAAIRDKQFVVFYQPKFNVRGDEPVLSSAEALVRWKHPKLGVVSPGTFIPLFEAQISDWKKRLNVSIPVSVNVSRIDLYDPDLTDRLLGIVKANGLSVEELLLEITESAYTENSDHIVEKVKKLRKLGFKIEIDDFGSGYSSLSMLSYMPIDALKLDMQFIRSAFGERIDTRLLEAMIRLADSFGVPTIAEGVETAEQVSVLKRMGCDIIQGYYFSRPLPADEFEKFIKVKQPVLV